MKVTIADHDQQSLTADIVRRGFPESAAGDATGWMMATLATGTVLSMGHRGASEVPGIAEFSRRAFDFAVEQGYPLLEISTNRTSDGHWICTHDTSLNRTSLTEGLPPISQMTLDEVRRHHNVSNGAEPADYELLDELLARYTPTHILAVDPKGSWKQVESLLDVCDRHGGSGRIMGKTLGTDPAFCRFLTDAFHARGYLIGGYWYDEEFRSGKIARVESMFDLTGMDFRASVEAWDYLLGLKKPIIGHILPHERAAQIAIDKGASILQTARPDLCPARSWWT